MSQYQADENGRTQREQKQVVLGLDEEEEGAEEQRLTFISIEKKEYTISAKAAAISKLVATTLSGDSSAVEINLFHIEGAIIERVIEYMEYHETVPPRRIEKPLESNVMSDLVDSFDANFADVDQETIFKLLLAANYMDIKPLLALMSAKVASMMKGLTPDQIRKKFNIRNDYTADEEAQVRHEHRDLIG